MIFSPGLLLETEPWMGSTSAGPPMATCLGTRTKRMEGLRESRETWHPARNISVPKRTTNRDVLRPEPLCRAIRASGMEGRDVQLQCKSQNLRPVALYVPKEFHPNGGFQ